MKAGYRIVDTELHLIEPAGLWERGLPEPYRSQTNMIRPDYLRKDSGSRFEFGGKKMDERPPNEWESLVQKQSARRLAEEPRLVTARERCEPEVYLDGMDVEGIDVALLMPTITFLATTWDGLDPEHSLALCRVYNDFAAKFAASDRRRFRFWGWLPRQDARLAADEARRCVEELGAIGVAMTQRAVNGHLLSDEFFSPLWKEVERLGVPAGFHVGGSVMQDDLRARYRGHRRSVLVGRTFIRQFYAGTSLA
jgi:predicted TIM-barrel fold metal-dependent hydrolase